jgi:hypothetical protein
MGDIGLSCHQMGNQIASSKGIEIAKYSLS